MKNKHTNRFNKTFKLHEVKELQKQNNNYNPNRKCFYCKKEIGEFDCNVTYLYIREVGYYFHFDPCALKYLGGMK